MFVKPAYVYRCTLIRVIDGDTVDVNIDVGFHTTIRKRIRVFSIDTEELRGGTEETKERANLGSYRMEELLNMGKLYVETQMDAEGKYGRVLGDFFVETLEGTINVSETLLAEGYAKGTTTPITESIQYL